MRNSLLLLLLALAALSLVTCDQLRAEDTSCVGLEDVTREISVQPANVPGISSFLSNLTIDLPVITTLIGESGAEKNATLSNLTCWSIAVAQANITTTTWRKNSSETASLARSCDGSVLLAVGDLSGIKISCSGSYDIVPIDNNRERAESGTVAIALEEEYFDVAASFYLARSAELLGRQLYANISSCNTRLVVVNLTFSNKLLEEERNKIALVIERDVNKHMCPALSGFVTTNIDSLLGEWSETLSIIVAQVIDYSSPPTLNFDATMISASLGLGLFLIYVIVLSTVGWVRQKRRATFFLASSSSINNAEDTRRSMSYERGGADEQPSCGSVRSWFSCWSASVFNTADRDILGLHPSVPRAVSIVVALLFFVNLAMFSTCDFSVGGTVYAVASSGNPGTDPHAQSLQHPIFTFSLRTAVQLALNAKVFPLAIADGIGSGAWPGLKLLLLFVAWVCPMKHVHRGRLLRMLDAHGKWCMIAFYIYAILGVAFRYSVNLTSFLTVDLYVQPNIGFTLLMLAIFFSYALSHALLAMHYHLDWPTAEQLDEQHYSAGASEQHHRHKGERHSRCSGFTKHALAYATFEVAPGRSFAFTLLGRWVVTCALLISAGLFLGGFFVIFYGIDVDGIAGFIFSLSGLSTHRAYSVISLGAGLPESAFYAPNSPYIRLVQAFYFVFTVAAPGLHVLVVLLVWLWPLKPARQRVVFQLVEILNAWSTFEAFVVTLLVLLQMGALAAYIVSAACGTYDSYLSRLLGTEVVCFICRTMFTSASALTFVGFGCYYVTSALVHHLLLVVVEARASKAKHQDLHPVLLAKRLFSVLRAMRLVESLESRNTESLKPIFFDED